MRVGKPENSNLRQSNFGLGAEFQSYEKIWKLEGAHS
jgi:hypothetical protein